MASADGAIGTQSLLGPQRPVARCKGQLRYRRGMVMIADRQAVTASACDCYTITRRLLDRLYT